MTIAAYTSQQYFSLQIRPDFTASSLAEIELLSPGLYAEKYIMALDTGIIYYVEDVDGEGVYQVREAYSTPNYKTGQIQQGTSDSSLVIDRFYLTPQNITDRYVTLSATPYDPAEVEFAVFNGPEQLSGVDFMVTGNILSWDMLALQYLLEAGDTIAVRYVV